MAKSVTTKFYADATAKCSNCGSTYKLGMSVENLTLEVCGNCHPFYTGKETRVDTAGVIERFEARMAKAQAGVSKKIKVKKRKSSMTLADLESDTQATVSESEVTIKEPGISPDEESTTENVVQDVVENTEEAIAA